MRNLAGQRVAEEVIYTGIRRRPSKRERRRKQHIGEVCNIEANSSDPLLTKENYFVSIIEHLFAFIMIRCKSEGRNSTCQSENL